MLADDGRGLSKHMAERVSWSFTGLLSEVAGWRFGYGAAGNYILVRRTE